MDGLIFIVVGIRREIIEGDIPRNLEFRTDNTLPNLASRSMDYNVVEVKRIRRTATALDMTDS
jgi:hypothetical protein